MTAYLSLTSVLLLRAVDGKEITVRESRGYTLDDRPQGWLVFDFHGVVVDDDSAARIENLQRGGLVEYVESGPVLLTDKGREALR